ncbi:MAG: hypothetical protein RL346_1622 [Verrucomicrobiota bacterium]
MKGKSGYDRKQQGRQPQGGLMIIVLVFASGAAGLMYQVSWMKQLGLLFGNTSQAAAATLAAFFAGLGTGSWWWGKRLSGATRPMRSYAWLEFGIAVSALTYFAILKMFHAVYPSLHAAVQGTAWIWIIKFALALLLIFPASFFMGGTIPAIGQAAIRDPNRLGHTGALLYGMNTLGAAMGLAFAAFVLVPSFGFTFTYAITLALSLAVGVIAWSLRDSSPPPEPEKAVREKTEETAPPGERIAIGVVCFFSGFVILALEVVWTRIFAQVHENSVYSYAIILIVVLIGLALGSVISSVISRCVRNPWSALSGLILIGGVLLVLGPFILMHVTHGLAPVSSLEPWSDYVRGLFNTGFRGIGIVVIALGTVFPFLMKVVERGAAAPGWKLGKLLAINTLGSIAGAVLCGFFMLPILGMWKSLQILTIMYLTLGLVLPLGWGTRGITLRVLSIAFLVLSLTASDPGGLPVAGNLEKEGKVMQAWEDSDGTVTVIERPSGHRVIKINGSYGLGSTAAYLEQTYQARIPLLLFPQTKSVFFLGLGTGISAGAAFDKSFPNVDRVVTCEIIPAVVEASKRWIPEKMTGGLFSDARSSILIEDGRHALQASSEQFDMINADLFLPYQRGAGSLYSLEHFRVVASRLHDDGVFVQWLPLYQLTEYEFGVICRTMLEVFGDVTLWRNNFQPGQEKIALMARKKSVPFMVPRADNQESLAAAVEGLTWQATTPDMFRVAAESIPFLYAGNLTASKQLFGGFPINTDDRPVIEYQTPKTFREVAQHDKIIWCVGPRLIGWLDRLAQITPPENDPSWSGHPESSLHFIRAGNAFQRAMVSKAAGDFLSADNAWQTFLDAWRSAAK